MTVHSYRLATARKIIDDKKGIFQEIYWYICSCQWNCPKGTWEEALRRMEKHKEKAENNGDTTKCVEWSLT